jgi:hypothetical protein
MYLRIAEHYVSGRETRGRRREVSGHFLKVANARWIGAIISLSSFAASLSDKMIAPDS